MFQRGIVSVLLAACCLQTISARAQGGIRITSREHRWVESLQEVVGEIAWKPQQQGALLIVDPANVRRGMGFGRPTTQMDVRQATAPFPQKSPAGLRLATLEYYFGSVTVPCGTVTVFAPSRMTVLHAENLPKPSPLAGIGAGESFLILQGTLTQTQWQQFASPNGLGLSDLDEPQRKLFLAAFPAGMVLRRDHRPSSDVPLQEPQRQRLRIRISRQMMWRLVDNLGTTLGGGKPDDNPLELDFDHKSGFKWKDAELFGTVVKEEVPAKFKPGQLAFDGGSMNVAVNLSGVKTVGDLVQRVGKATRAELYCDSRYAHLPIYLRGDQAKAGNLLRAVARGVTGTWRRVENAYVLTDDVEGLATRQTRIVDWVDRNVAEGIALDNRINDAIRKADPSSFIQYTDEAFKPSDSLLADYRRHQKDLARPRTADEPRPNPNRFWSVSRLPAAIQQQIRKQAQELDSHGLVRSSNGDSEGQPIVTNAESVDLNFGFRITANVPGVGWVNAPGGVSHLSFIEEQESTAYKLEAPSARPLPTNLKSRALRVRLTDATTLDTLYQAATRAGFNEIWAEVDGVAPETLTKAVQAAHAARFKFRGIVSALRQKPGEGVENGADKNILGETSTQSVARLLQGEVISPMFLNDAVQQQHASEIYTLVLKQQQERGDWCDPDAPGAASSLPQTVETLLKTVPLDGIVLQDVGPPGYVPVDRNMSNYLKGFGRDGGYSTTRRLAFLRRFGVDPVDISLAPRVPVTYSGLRFRDAFPTDLQILSFQDSKGSALPGNRTALETWDRFRQAALEATLEKIQARVQAAAGATPVWFYQKPAEWHMALSYPGYVESRDKVSKVPEATDMTQLLRRLNQNSGAPPPHARADSRTLLYNYEPALGALMPWTDSLEGDMKAVVGYMFDPKATWLREWDGIVFDLGVQTPGEAVSLLGVLPTPPSLK